MSTYRIADEDIVIVNDAWNKVLRNVGVNQTAFKFADAFNALVTGINATPTIKIVSTTSGTGIYTSIKTAIDSITDASAIKPYLINVNPGTYNEAPFALKPYVSIVGLGVGFNDVIVNTTNNSANFITSAPNSGLEGMTLKGPTGVGFATIYHDDVGGVWPLIGRNIYIQGGYYGVWCNNGLVNFINLGVIATAHMNQAIRVTGGGSVNALMSMISTDGAGIDQCVYVLGTNAYVSLDGMAFVGAGVTDCVFADDDATVRMNSCTFSGSGANAIHVGATGASTIKTAATQIIGNYTKSVLIDTAAARIDFIGSADSTKIDAPVNSFAGTVVDSNIGQVVYGDLYLQDPDTNATPLPVGSFIKDTAQTGWTDGGLVTRTAGLQIHVTAGSGYIAEFFGDLDHVAWGATDIDLTANQAEGWIVVDDTGLVKEMLSTPDPTQVIILADTATNATNVVLLASRRVELWNRAALKHIYTRDVVGPINVSGGSVVKHANPSLQLDIDTSTYYIYDDRKTSVSAAPATFTRWYRKLGGGGGIMSPVLQQLSQNFMMMAAALYKPFLPEDLLVI